MSMFSLTLEKLAQPDSQWRSYHELIADSPLHFPATKHRTVSSQLQAVRVTNHEQS